LIFTHPALDRSFFWWAPQIVHQNSAASLPETGTSDLFFKKVFCLLIYSIIHFLCYVVQIGLELMMHLPQSSEYWDYRCAPTYSPYLSVLYVLCKGFSLYIPVVTCFQMFLTNSLLFCLTFLMLTFVPYASHLHTFHAW
jgi:hypothetical protein